MNASQDPPVSGLDVGAYTIPTDQPEADGTLTWDSTTLVLVRVRAGRETGTGWTYAPPAAAHVVTDLLEPVVTGRGALDVTRSYHAMVDAVRNAGRPGMVSMAISAVDTALWDLKARLLDLPLHRLLGHVHDDVPVYGSGGFTTYDDDRMSDQLGDWVGTGMTSVKIKIGEEHGRRVDRDLERIRRARQVIGDDVDLFVDANGAYTANQAIDVAGRAEEVGLGWFEEPVSSDDLRGLSHVRRGVRPDVTAGEYGFDLPYFQRMCEADAVDCLQVDVTRCGGITEWVRVAAVAAAHGLSVSGHCAPALHVGVAAATPNLRHLEWFHDHVRIEGMLFDGVPAVADGVVRPAGTAGHGLSFRDTAAAEFRVSP